MPSRRLPSALVDHYHQLLRDRVAAVGAVRSIDRQLSSLAYALKIVDPKWEPPPHPAKLQAPSRLQQGTVARDCLKVLMAGPLSTPDIARSIAAARRLELETNEDWLKFCSAVAMALRRYARKGFVKELGRNAKTGALMWALAVD